MNRAIDIRDTQAPKNPPLVLLSSAERRWSGLEAEFLRIPAGVAYVPASASLRLGVHFGRAVNADCRCDGQRHRRIQRHGDIDIVPAGLDGVWEDDADCEILRLRVDPALLQRAAADLGRDPDAVAPRFQLRDPGIESIAWAIKAELESDLPSGPLYAETLGFALALRHLDVNNRADTAARQTLSARQSRRLIDFIENGLEGSLSLSELAAVADVSVSHLKTLFQNTFGAPAHQYVLSRRIERARALILSSDMPMSHIALAAGFADQSHMARCMRRILGTDPQRHRSRARLMNAVGRSSKALAEWTRLQDKTRLFLSAKSDMT